MLSVCDGVIMLFDICVWIGKFNGGSVVRYCFFEMLVDEILLVFVDFDIVLFLLWDILDED